MIAVISDLHLEEESSDVIRGNGKEIIFRRNLDPKAYRSFIAHMADEVLAVLDATATPACRASSIT